MPSAHALATGLQHDRTWMIVDDQGSFVTQRQYPALAQIKTQLTATQLIMSHTGHGEMTVPLDTADGAVMALTVWKDRAFGIEPFTTVSTWITDIVKSPKALHLVAFDKNHPRKLQRTRFGDGQTYFADAAPYLVLNQSSIDALNNKLASSHQAAVDTRHFRANIVIRDLPAFAEQEASQLICENGQTFNLVDPCQRCSVITVDPDKGSFREKQSPFKTLAALNPMPDKPKAPAMGMNATLSATKQSKEINVGQSVLLV